MNNELTAITPAKWGEVVRHCVIDLDEPAIVHGTFGLGKSSVTEQACREAGAVLVDIRLSQYDSVDLRGFPGVDRDTGQTVWYPPSTLPFVGNDQFPDDRPVVVLFDEISSAPTSVLAVAFQLFNDRRAGEHVFKPNVRLCAATNLDTDKGIVNRMPLPLLNRTTQYLMTLDVDSLCHHALRVGIPPIFVAFWKFRTDLVSTYDPKESRKVIATPRTWFKAAKYYASSIPDDLKRLGMEGAVGQAAATAFWAFKEVWQRVTPIKQIIADPMGAPLPDEESFRYATAMNVSGAMNLKTVGPLYAYLKRLPVEFLVMAWTMACQRDPGLYSTEEYIDFAVAYREVFSGR